jgi:AcrR family transcriptional regulator
MSPRPNVSEERKDQILNAAEEVFTEKGFDEARMEDIADELGLSKGTVYLYFKSKNDLIISILDRLFEREFSQLEKREDENMSAVESILNFTELMANDVGRMLRLIPIVYEFLALAFRNKYVQYALKEYLNRYLVIITKMVQRGVDSGELKPVDPMEVAIAIGAIMEGTLLLWVYDKSLVDPRRHIRSGMRLLLSGIQAQT